jgi:hypothetical protein
MRILISPEIRDYLPPRTTDERDRLRASLKKEGCRDKLVVWKQRTGPPILVDGHGRKEICDEEGIPYEVEEMEFASIQEAKQWAIDNQLARRNMSAEKRDYFMALDFRNARQPHGGQLPKGMAQNEPSLSTAEIVAEKHHVSPATVKRAAQFADAVDKIRDEQGPAAMAEILAGKSGMTKAEIRQVSELERSRMKEEIEGFKLRKKKEQRKKTPAAANGRVVFNDQKVTDAFALLVRLLGQRKDAKGDHPERDKCMDRLDEALSAFTRWQRARP